jgi:hypothetical protein
MRPVGLDQRELQGGSMVVEGMLTHPCPSFAVGKLAMVVVRVQGAPPVTALVLGREVSRRSPGWHWQTGQSQRIHLLPCDGRI